MNLCLFLDTQFLAWLEVLGVLGDVGVAAVALTELMNCLQQVCFSVSHCIVQDLCRANQAYKDSCAVEIAEDFFHFVTKFFEPISLSATHIYHSALEMCPESSIVRKKYYHRCRRVAHSPRVIVGIADSWKPTISISNDHHGYDSSTWSPCGRFIAARAGDAIEVRNQLTFELLTILQPDGSASKLEGAVSYSPDGSFIACPSSNAIIIWDIQTGGVAREIDCSPRSTSLVWSSGGRTIGVVSEDEAGSSVQAYGVTSGTRLVNERFESRGNLLLSAHEESFMVVTVQHGMSTVISIFDSEHGLVENSAGYTGILSGSWELYSFSPTTRGISLSTGGVLYVFRLGERLLQKVGRYISSCFSSDGSCFAASGGGGGRNLGV